MAPIADKENDEISLRDARNENEDCLPDVSRDRLSFGIEGWRKRCIFGLLIVLILMVVTNLALTLWIMSVMKVHKNGIGPLKITSDGIQLSGEALFLDSLVSSSIKSRPGQSLSIDSFDNFTVRTTDRDGNVDNRMFFDKNKLEITAKEFYVWDPLDNLLFYSNKNEVSIGAENFKIQGDGGITFNTSVCTPTVRSEPGDDLTLESPTRSMDIKAPMGITMYSKTIEANSMTDFLLKSREGSIVLDSSKIQMRNLQKAVPGLRIYRQRSENLKHKIFQLCLCASGRLFLASSEDQCQTYDSVHICEES